MRTPIIAGNWKMHKTPAESVEFVKALAPRLAEFPKVERVVIPTFVALPGVRDVLAVTDIAVGAQDVHHEEKGAFTGCIAASMLVGLAEYVIVGHSETRKYLGVTDELVNKKAKAALAHGLKVIIAMGETLTEYEKGEAETVCSRQIKAAFEGIPATHLRNVVIAYEPVWAIGTGKNADPEYAKRIIGGVIRPLIQELYGAAEADAMRIQYGGSVTPDNMADYMRLADIDGALVGGASLEVEKFVTLVRLAAEAKGLS